MNIRLIGDGDQVHLAVAALETTPGLRITAVSRPYTARGGDGRMRIYLDAEITLARTPAGGDVR